MVSGGPVFLNPDHVVQVTRHVRCGSQVVTPMGERLHVDLDVEELVGRLTHQMPEALRRLMAEPSVLDKPTEIDVDLRDSVRENLNR